MRLLFFVRDTLTQNWAEITGDTLKTVRHKTHARIRTVALDDRGSGHQKILETNLAHKTYCSWLYRVENGPDGLLEFLWYERRAKTKWASQSDRDRFYAVEWWCDSLTPRLLALQTPTALFGNTLTRNKLTDFSRKTALNVFNLFLWMLSNLLMVRMTGMIFFLSPLSLFVVHIVRQDCFYLFFQAIEKRWPWDFCVFFTHSFGKTRAADQNLCYCYLSTIGILLCAWRRVSVI